MIRRVIGLMLCLSAALPVVIRADAAAAGVPKAVADALHLTADHPLAQWTSGKLDASDSLYYAVFSETKREEDADHADRDHPLVYYRLHLPGIQGLNFIIFPPIEN